MSASQCRETLRKCVVAVTGIEPDDVQKLFGTQSLRSGGATQIIRKNVDFRLFMQHGAWHTAAAAHRYIEDSLDTRLSVTRAMQY